MNTNVLIISFWNPSIRLPKNGIFIHEQINALCEKRSDILVLEVNILPAKSLFFDKRISEKALFGNKSIEFTINSVFWKLIYSNPWLVYILLKQYLKKKYPMLQPEIIHSNIVFPCGVVGYLFSRRYHAVHIISEHWSKADKIISHPLFGFATMKAFKTSKVIICVSGFLKEKVQKAVGRTDIKVIPNIVDTIVFHFKPKNSLNINFACVAAWMSPKRLDLIVNSLVLFAKETEEKLELNIVGDGEQTNSFRMIILPENLKINWYGYISKIGIANVLHKTSYFLHASDTETFSIVVAEALSTGTPVLASNVGALPELVHSENGILVDNTVQAWVKGLREITHGTFDREKIAMEVSGRYSPSSVGQSIIDVYSEVISIPGKQVK